MPRTGATFNLPTNANYPAIDATVIDPDDHNATLEDIATALTNSVSRDGAGSMSGALAMGSNKITGLAAATSNGDAVRYEQAQLASAVATAWEGLSWATNKFGYAVGSTSFALADITAGGRALLGVTGVTGYFTRYTSSSAAEAYNLFGTAGTWTATQTGTRWAVDANAYLDLNSGNPQLAYDANDYWQFNRSSNVLDYVVGGSTILQIGPTGEVILDDVGPTQTTAAGYRGTIINIQDNDYTPVLSDAGKTIYHTSATPHTYTIPANASVAYPVGTIIQIENENGAGNITLAITSDTLRWESSTGSRTLSANASASIKKMTTTTWRLVGVNVS